MNDPLDQAQALEAMDAVAGLYDFVNANVGELLRKSGKKRRKYVTIQVYSTLNGDPLTFTGQGEEHTTVRQQQKKNRGPTSSVRCGLGILRTSGTRTSLLHTRRSLAKDSRRK